MKQKRKTSNPLTRMPIALMPVMLIIAGLILLIASVANAQTPTDTFDFDPTAPQPGGSIAQESVTSPSTSTLTTRSCLSLMRNIAAAHRTSMRVCKELESCKNQNMLNESNLSSHDKTRLCYANVSCNNLRCAYEENNNPNCLRNANSVCISP